MRNYWVFRVIGAIVLLIGIVAVGFIAYNAGVANGQTLAPAVQSMGPWRGGMEGHSLVGGLIFLPFLFCLVPLFLGFFIFLPMRMMFGAHRMHMHGRWHGEEGSVPTPFEEWHRRMHEKTEKTDKPS